MKSNTEEKIHKIMGIALVSVIVIFVITAATIVIFSISKSVLGIKDAIEMAKIRNDITSGEIIDKYAKDGYISGGSSVGMLYNPESGSLCYGIALDDNDTYIPKRYYLTIGIEYEFNGEIIVSSKDFEVERDVYLTYNIGDYFDSEIIEEYTVE